MTSPAEASAAKGRSARPYLYLAYIGAGAHALIIGSAPGAVEQSMGTHAALAWAVLLIVGPVLALTGTRAEHTASGLWLWLSGDIAFASTSAAYSFAVYSAAWSDRATYSAWIAGALAVCGVRWAADTARQIWRVAAMIHEVEGGSRG
jgi:hypothetical protein